MARFIGNLQSKVRSVTKSERKHVGKKEDFLAEEKDESPRERKVLLDVVPKQKNRTFQPMGTHRIVDPADQASSSIPEELALTANENESKSTSTDESSGSLLDLRRPETTQPPLTSVISPRSNFTPAQPSTELQRARRINYEQFAKGQFPGAKKEVNKSTRKADRRERFQKVDAKILGKKTDVATSIRKILPTGMKMDANIWPAYIHPPPLGWLRILGHAYRRSYTNFSWQGAFARNNRIRCRRKGLFRFHQGCL